MAFSSSIFLPNGPSSLCTLYMSTEEETECADPAVEERNGRQSMLGKMSGMFRVPRPSFSMIPREGYFSPRPPNYSPKVEEQLQIDLVESERAIQLLQAEVNMVREKLDIKEDELLSEQNYFREKMQGLAIEKNAATKLAEERENQITDTVQQQQNQQQIRETKLLSEIQLLSNQLENKTTEYMAALETISMLKENLAMTQNAQQQDQLQFRTEKQALEAIIQGGEQSIVEMKEQLMDQEKNFDALQKDLKSQVESSHRELQAAHSEWDVTKGQLEETKMKLQVASLQKNDVVEQNMNAFTAEKAKIQSKLEQLEQRIVLEKNSTLTAELTIEKERAAFEDAIRELTLRVKQQETTISHLETKLLEEQVKFETEVSTLEAKWRREAEESRITKSDASKSKALLKEKKRLEQELATLKELHSEKTAKLTSESEEMRRELVERLAAVESETNSQEAELKQSYDKKLAEEETKAQILEQELSSLKLANEEISASLSKAQLEKAQSIEEAKNVQTKYDSIQSDYEIFEERISLLDTEFREMKTTKEQLEVTLNQVNLEKEEATLKAQELELNYTTLLEQNAARERAEHQKPNSDGLNSFQWAIDRH